MNAVKRRRLADTVLTLLLTVTVSASLLVLWLWALALWYPASTPRPGGDPNHGCGPMVACLEAAPRAHAHERIVRPHVV